MLALSRPSISMIDGEHASWSRSSSTRGLSARYCVHAAGIGSKQDQLETRKWPDVIGQLQSPTKIIVQANENASLEKIAEHTFIKRYFQRALVFIALIVQFAIAAPPPELRLRFMPWCLAQFE